MLLQFFIFFLLITTLNAQDNPVADSIQNNPDIHFHLFITPWKPQVFYTNAPNVFALLSRTNHNREVDILVDTSKCKLWFDWYLNPGSHTEFTINDANAKRKFTDEEARIFANQPDKNKMLCNRRYLRMQKVIMK